MKKIYAFLLAGLMAASMAACGNKTPEVQAPTEDEAVDIELVEEEAPETAGSLVTYDDPENYERVEVAGYPTYQYQNDDVERTITVMVLDEADMEEMNEFISAAEAEDVDALREQMNLEEGEGQVTLDTINGYAVVRGELAQEETGTIAVDYFLLSSDHVVLLTAVTNEEEATALDNDLVGIIESIQVAEVNDEEAVEEESAEGEDEEEAVVEESTEESVEEEPAVDEAPEEEPVEEEAAE